MASTPTGGEGAKYVRLEVNIWRRDDGQIAIASSDGRLISTVNDRPESVRRHPHLFGRLKRLLQEEGCWPSER